MAIMNKSIQTNIGQIDRTIRTIVGVWLILSALSKISQTIKNPGKLISGIGILVTAQTGRCPLMSMMGASTVQGQENNIINQMKHAMPGQGINPMQTQQAIPIKPTKALNADQPLSQALVVA